MLVLVVVWLRTKPANVAEAVTGIQEASEFARVAVAAAEQLWSTGKLPRDQRLDYALKRLQAEFPWLEGQQAQATVEAAVYWLKQLQAAKK